MEIDTEDLIFNYLEYWYKWLVFIGEAKQALYLPRLLLKTTVCFNIITFSG